MYPTIYIWAEYMSIRNRKNKERRGRGTLILYLIGAQSFICVTSVNLHNIL